MTFRHSLHRDYETKSTVDLRKCGVHVYAEHSSTDAWCCAYGVDDEPGKLWIPGQPVPEEFKEAARNPEWEVVAHNDAFEDAIELGPLARRYGWPAVPIERHRCTMAQVSAMSLPASLGNAAAAVGLAEQKDSDGRDLMLRMARPRRPRKGENPKGIYWFDDEERKQRLFNYCLQDLATERELDRNILKLRPAEQRLWILDAIINRRGIYVDVPLCEAALRIVEQASQWLDDELREITNGEVSAVTNVNQISKWLREQGHQTDSLDKEHIDDMLLQPGLPVPVRRVLEIRREGAKAAVKKIDALLAGRSADGRARGLLQFHAAGTGRWAGRRFQPHNIKRPDLEDVDTAIGVVATGEATYVDLVYGNPLAVVGDCLRGMMTAKPGNTLFAADFSNIEGRLIAWLADEEWKTQFFRDFDAGIIKYDNYVGSYAKLFGVPPETVKKPQRQIGKVCELASGFQGGVSAYMRFGIQAALPTLIPALKETGDDLEWFMASRKYQPSAAHGLSRDEWTAVRVAVDRWRAQHPNVAQYWYDLEGAALEAIENPGEVTQAGRIAFRVAGSFLFMRLPSGRSISYPYPCIKPRLMPWKDSEGKPVWRDCVSYKGVDTYTRKWTDCYAHGGLLFNNAVQGTARDIEAEAMVRVEARGYPIVLTVHDEVVSEVPAGFGSVEEFEELMTTLPEWAEGLPVAAEAWTARRYRK